MPETNQQLSNLISRWAVKATWTGSQGYEQCQGVLSYARLYARTRRRLLQIERIITRTVGANDRCENPKTRRLNYCKQRVVQSARYEAGLEFWDRRWNNNTGPWSMSVK
jgi:hypothetical protein